MMLNAYAQGAAEASGAGGAYPMYQLAMIVVIFVIFYFLLIRPQKRAQDEHRKMVGALKKNDEVITSGGIHGTITNVKEGSVVLKVDDNVKIEVQKSAVAALKKSRQG